MSRGPRRRKPPRGFALLEVLVAFVIAALALGGLLVAATDGLRASVIAGQYEEALARARSHLAAIGRAGPLVAGVQSGDDGGGFAWRSRVALLAALPVAGTGSSSGLRPALYAVGVVISWHRGGHARQVALQTERLGTAPPPAP